MAAEKLLPWAKPLLVSSTLTQATIYVLRPMITYRAIELDGNAAQIGLIAALYALFPVLLALQFGSWVGKLGEAKFIIYGTLAMMVTSGALIFADTIDARLQINNDICRSLGLPKKRQDRLIGIIERYESC